jgi:OmpA-OmpF porin, OOP family
MDRTAQHEGFHSMTISIASPSPHAHKALRGLAAGLSLAALLAAAPAFAQEAGDPLKQTPRQSETKQAAPAKEDNGALLDDKTPEKKAEPAADEEDRADVQATLKEETDIIRSLAPFVDGNPNAPPPAVREVDSDDGKVRVDYSRAIDITVFFEYDSAKLTPEARIQLEPLAKALLSEELKGYRFLLAGHTDATGDAGYNEGLSLKRAVAVRRFLSENYNINPSRLVVHGWGESRLKDPDHPRKSVNRRVEVALILPNKDQSFLGDRSFGEDWSDVHFSADLGPGKRLVIEHGDVRIEDRPFIARGRLMPGRYAMGAGLGAGCVRHRLSDPRWRLGAYDLDDFGAAPTHPCAERRLEWRAAPTRYSATYDALRGVWHDSIEDDFAK